MSILHRKRVRWPAEVLLLLVVLVALTVVNGARTCTSPEFGLPAHCDYLWVNVTMLVLAGLVVVGEAAHAVWRAFFRRLERLGDPKPKPHRSDPEPLE